MKRVLRVKGRQNRFCGCEAIVKERFAGLASEKHVWHNVGSDMEVEIWIR